MYITLLKNMEEWWLLTADSRGQKTVTVRIVKYDQK
jgi:hypothetical protein